MAKVIPLFGPKTGLSSNERLEIQLTMEDISGEWLSTLAFNPPVRPAMYLRLLKMFPFKGPFPVVEVNSNGSAFLLLAGKFGIPCIALASCELWFKFNQGLIEEPDLPVSVLTLQNYSFKLVSLKDFQEVFKPFYTAQTFADLVNFRSFIGALPSRLGSFLKYATALILHGDGSAYLSAPSPSGYSRSWQEQLTFVSSHKAYP
ncbi:MAG: hypothetical protein N2654_04410, partial [Deltaproteobacteria bacterium]|nr:hypothetical protein [Deltaproteobacteria bacterium]